MSTPVIDFKDDWIAFPHPVGILDELKKVLRRRALPPIECFSSIVPGDNVAIDYVDDCGSMAYGRVVTIFPSTNFPNQDVTPREKIILASTVEIGIFRGITVDPNGEPPTESQQYEDARLQLADGAAIIAAICAYCESNEIPMVAGSYTPVGPQGAAVGGFWTATLAST